MKEVKFDRLSEEEKAEFAKSLVKFRKESGRYVVAMAEVHPVVMDRPAQIKVTVRSIETGKTREIYSENLSDWIQRFHDQLKEDKDF
jgi:hypothetical protein